MEVQDEVEYQVDFAGANPPKARVSLSHPPPVFLTLVTNASL